MTITLPLIEEEWGERAPFQVRDPNGIVIQLVEWNAPTTSRVKETARA